VVVVLVNSSPNAAFGKLLVILILGIVVILYQI